MAGAKKLKGVAKQSSRQLHSRRAQLLPPPPSVADDVVAELHGSTLEEIVQRAQGSVSKHSHPPSKPAQKQPAPPITNGSRTLASEYRIGKGGCRVKTLPSKTLYKSSATSGSAHEFLQSCERGRARKAAQS